MAGGMPCMRLKSSSYMSRNDAGVGGEALLLRRGFSSRLIVTGIVGGAPRCRNGGVVGAGLSSAHARNHNAARVRVCGFVGLRIIVIVGVQMNGAKAVCEAARRVRGCARKK